MCWSHVDSRPLQHTQQHSCLKGLFNIQMTGASTHLHNPQVQTRIYCLNLNITKAQEEDFYTHFSQHELHIRGICCQFYPPNNTYIGKRKKYRNFTQYTKYHHRNPGHSSKVLYLRHIVSFMRVIIKQQFHDPTYVATQFVVYCPLAAWWWSVPEKKKGHRIFTKHPFY